MYFYIFSDAHVSIQCGKEFHYQKSDRTRHEKPTRKSPVHPRRIVKSVMILPNRMRLVQNKVPSFGDSTCVDLEQ